MRVDPILLEYCRQVNKYKTMGIPVPESIENTYRVRQSIDQTQRTLWRYASDGAIPKAGWQWIDNLPKEIIPDDIPESLLEAAKRVKEVVISLKDKLSKNSDLYLVDGFTLTKLGRKQLRGICEEIKLICKEYL